MNANRKRTLSLNRETIRALTTGEMQGIAGGAPKPTETSHSCGCTTTCPTKTCPPPPCSSSCHHCVAGPVVMFRM
jgi:hypothetical protein